LNENQTQEALVSGHAHRQNTGLRLEAKRGIYFSIAIEGTLQLTSGPESS